MAFNFQDMSTPSSLTGFGDRLKQGVELYQNNYKFNQAKTLNDLFAKYVGVDGTLDDIGFYKAAKAAGIGDEMVKTAIGNKTSQSKAAVEEATNQDQLKMLGKTPDTTRAFKNPETQTSQQEAKSDVKDWTEMKPAQWLIPMKGLSTEPDTRSENEKKISDEWDASVAVSPVKVTQSQSAEEETTMDPKTGEYTTTIKKPEVKSKAVYTPEDPGEYRMAPKPDTFEQKYSAVEEMLRPSEGGSILDRTSTATIENPYKLQNMGVSSVFAKDWLRKSGLPVSQEGLDTAFRIYSAGVQKPSIKSKDGRIDLYATREDQNRYEAELQKKSSEFMKDIISGNTTSIAEKVSQENLTMAQAKRKEEAESAEADIAGRRTDGAGNNFRPVSKEEATKGRMMSEAYRDLAAARNIPDAFPKAMQAATSKLKANSVPVTMDNIVGELVSQGSIPSKSAITIKSLLGNGTGVADLTSKFFLETGSQLVMDDNRTDAYIKQNLKDMTDGLASVGFNPPETKVEVETGGKKETAPSKMVSAKPADIITKKTAKPGSVGAPILYTKGMKTEKGKYYNVNGKLVLSKGGN